ncbi:MAG: BON domain-containing protein [Deltaproteobacteria bacterium]
MVNLSCLTSAIEHQEREAAAPGRASETPSRFARITADVRLAVTVRDALRASGHRQVRRVRGFVRAGVVVLRGTVSRYYYKQLALAAVLPLEHVQALRDEIVVLR